MWDPERILWVHREGRLAGQYAYGDREVSLYLDPGGSFMPRRFGTTYNSDTGSYWETVLKSATSLPFFLPRGRRRADSCKWFSCQVCICALR